MRRLRLGVLILIVFGASAAAFFVAPAAAASGFSFTFDSDSEAWESTQDAAAFVTPAWSPSIGNPGGGISIADTNPHAADGFFSPESLGGGFGADVGGTLSFDIASSNSWTGEAGLVLYGVAGEEMTILCAGDETVIPGPSYKTAHLILDGQHTLRLNVETGVCGTHPSDRVVSEVLSNLLVIYIPGEDVEASNDVTEIDNVKLSGGASGVSPGPKPLRCKKGFKKKRVHGKLRCVKVKKKRHHHHRH